MDKKQYITPSMSTIKIGLSPILAGSYTLNNYVSDEGVDANEVLAPELQWYDFVY